MDDLSLESAAHVVQLALTPVFLLAGVATLLAVFAARLARVADKVDALSLQDKTAARDRALKALKLRSHALDVAVVLASLAGALTLATALGMFLGQVRGTGPAKFLFMAFGGAIVLTMVSLGAFVTEMLLAAKGVRAEVDQHAGNSAPR